MHSVYGRSATIWKIVAITVVGARLIEKMYYSLCQSFSESVNAQRLHHPTPARTRKTTLFQAAK
jgi:hypothetical protein